LDLPPLNLCWGELAGVPLPLLPDAAVLTLVVLLLLLLLLIPASLSRPAPDESNTPLNWL